MKGYQSMYTLFNGHFRQSLFYLWVKREEISFVRTPPSGCATFIIDSMIKFSSASVRALQLEYSVVS